MFMKRHLFCSVAAVATAFALPAFADDDPAKVEDVIVTATRLPAIVTDTPGARVIDSETIEKRGAVFAADILADIPGLSVVRTGAFGGVAQVRMRGAGLGKTLVLVDGVPVNDPADISGGFDFSGFELGDIERIEVLSGPQSSLWGSDAIGGVIAFTTKEIDGLRADAETGSYDTLRGRLAAGAANETYAVGAYVSRFDTNGISAADKANGNPEADGFENTTVGLNGRYSAAPGVSFDGSARWSKSDADLDGFPAPRYALADTFDTQSSEQWSGFGRAKVAALGLNHQLSVSASDIERSTVSSFPSTFAADRQVYRWQADGVAGSGRLNYTFGAERENTSGSLSSGLSDDLGVTSVFGVARLDLSDGFSVTGGLRWDDTDDFGSRTTGRISAAWDFASGITISSAYGTGFKAPSISQAVCDFCYSSSPFPILRPETAESVELALGWVSSDGRVQGRATVYRLKVEEQITYLFDPTTFDSYYFNVARTRTDGVEIEAKGDLGEGLDLTLAYAWTDAQDQTTGARLLRVPEQSGSVTLGWTGDRLSAALTVRAEGDQDDAGGVRDGFVTANLNGAFQLNRAVALTARIENLADEYYQHVLGYGEPGRSGYVGIRLRY